MTENIKKPKKGFYDYVEIVSKNSKGILKVGGSILFGIATKVIYDNIRDNK